MAEIWTTWPDWRVDDAGVERRQFPMDHGDIAVALHHPARPWRRTLGAGFVLDSPEFAQRVQAVAVDYVDGVAAALGFPLPPGAPPAAGLNLVPGPRDAEGGFGWLPSGGAGSARRVGGEHQVFMNLRIGNRWLDGDAVHPLGGGVAMGLDLVARRRDGVWEIQVLGSSSTRPAQWCSEPLADFTRASIGRHLAPLGERLRADLGLVAPPRFTGLRLNGRALARWQAVSGLGTLADGRTLQFEADLRLDAGGVLVPHLRSRAWLVTHGAPVFTGSPPGASAGEARPIRGPARLEPLRSETARLPASGDLKDAAAATPRWQVQRSAVAWRDPAQAAIAEAVPDPGSAGLRSDAQSALHAAIRAEEFFRRLDDYGRCTTEALSPSAKDPAPSTAVPPGLALDLVELPLVLRPRAPLRGAPDGDVVNAEVRVRATPGPAAPPGQFPMPAAVPCPVELRFGAGRPAHRERHGGVLGRDTAQALGIAADERWAWHEFGHVLVFAATGLLELRFAHGIGDALAVLVAAPDSPLAGQPGADGISFPWITNGRRHDRDARLGWCWCGRRSAWRHAASGNLVQRAGYFEEQLFSSAMHRSYLALGGGETGVDAAPRRRAASDYLVFLLMRSVLDLPRDAISPALAVEVLVDRMVALDLGIETWQCLVSWPEAPAPRPLRRTGGRVHKALRWAFEQQGLHAGAAPGTVVEGPATPKVDLYIEDLGRRGGHYTPLAVRWPTTAEGSLPWMAGDDGIARNGSLVVSVRNRGREPASGVQVLAWWARQTADGVPGAWAALQTVAPTQTPVSVGTDGAMLPVQFKPPVQGGAPVAAPYWVFAAVSCVADPASIDDNGPGGSGVPPQDAQELAELVALDNNCALRLIEP